MTPGEWVEALRRADLADLPAPIDRGRMLRRAHRMVRDRLVLVGLKVAAVAVVLTVAGAAVPTVQAEEPFIGQLPIVRDLLPPATPSPTPTDAQSPDVPSPPPPPPSQPDPPATQPGPQPPTPQPPSPPTTEPPQPNPLPDLTITRLEAWQVDDGPGFLITIANEGPAAAEGFMASIIVFQETILLEESATLPADSNQTYTVAWQCEPTEVRVTAVVDEQDDVVESAEDNNEREDTLDVSEYCDGAQVN